MAYEIDIECPKCNDDWFYICEKNSYRFYDRVSQGRIAVPNLKVVRLSCNGLETDEEYIELCCIELGFLIPIFQLYLELREVGQLARIERLREFIGGKVSAQFTRLGG